MQEPWVDLQASLLVTGASSMHCETEEKTGLVASRTYAGQDVNSDVGSEKSAQTVWLFDSALPQESNLGAHMSWLWEQIRPHQEYFQEMIDSGVDVKICSHYRTNFHGYGFNIEAGSLDLLLTLDLPLCVSLEVVCGKEKNEDELRNPWVEFGASFRVCGAPDRHAEIERMTGLLPDHSHTKQDLKPKIKKNWTSDIWMLHSSAPANEELTAHLASLCERIRPHRTYFRKLASSGVEINFYCKCRSNKHRYRVLVEPEILRIISELKFTLQMSVYVGECRFLA